VLESECNTGGLDAGSVFAAVRSLPAYTNYKPQCQTKYDEGVPLESTFSLF